MITRCARLGLALFTGLVLLLTGCAGGSATDRATGSAPSRTPAAAPSRTPGATAVSGLPTVRESELPAEARRTLALIRSDGPYPYAKDGAVFSNFEKVLPQRKRGYYHEYTVKTPGERDRGARRIVTGRDGEIYYTDDHYESFREVVAE